MSNSGGGGGGGGGGSARVSIPNSARKTIQNIREIAGNHSDEEIYAMLRECSMDPNETTQKLLHQDTFHEVKRRRDRRKENVSNKDFVDASWRSSTQGRGGRSGRGNFSSRHLSQDSVVVKVNPAKESLANHKGPEKVKVPIAENIENKSDPLPSNSIYEIADGHAKLAQATAPHGNASQAPSNSGVTPSEESVTDGINKFPPSEDINIKCGQVPDASIEYGVKTEHSSSSLTSHESGVHESVLNPVTEPSPDSRTTCVVGRKKPHIGNQDVEIKPTSESAISCGATCSNHSSTLRERRITDGGDLYGSGHVKLPESNNHLEESQPRPTSSGTGTSGSRPSSNYSNRSQQLIVPQKAAPVKEWKPKQVIPNVVHSCGRIEALEVPGVASGDTIIDQSSEERTSELQKKLEQLHFSDGQHVIFPSHIQVPASERAMLSFGSFTASFAVSSSFPCGPEDNRSCSPLSESSQELEENVVEPSSSLENDSPASQEGAQSPEHISENLSSGEAEISKPSVEQGHDNSQLEMSLPSGSQYSIVQNAPSFNLMPPMVGNSFVTFDGSESQSRDTSQLSGFVVQQPFDTSASYYPQIYHAGVDGDGRNSPFRSSGPASVKQAATLSSPIDQSQQESGNSLIQSATVPAVTPSSAVMQNSVAITHQPVPAFRQPTGVHLSHYPSNYIPYPPYLFPFYLPTQSVHPFMSTGGFAQQHPNTPLYPPVAAAAAPVKYPISQFKTGTNSTNSNLIGMTAGYGPFSSSQTGYSPNSASTAVNSATNEDLSSQYKENNVYLPGQQAEGSALWIPAPGRDVPGLQAGSFYNLPHGQHLTFTPTQAGHGAFPGIFHPTQMTSASVHPLLQQSQTMAGAVEMVGPQAGVYPHPQRPPINWANNY